MATNFPTNPNNGDTHAGFTYNSTKGVWVSSAASPSFVSLSDTPSSLGTAGQVAKVNSGGTALEFADQSGVTSYANFAAFPSTGNNLGDLAVAQDTKAMYMWDDTGWDRIDNGDESPVIITEPPATHDLDAGGSTTSLSMTAQDPEGFDIIYGIAYKTANNARPIQLGADTTINQSTGTYTFTPSTNTANSGVFKARLSASDGANVTTRFVDIELDFTMDMEYLVVAGGGGGGGNRGGGGGAGGLLYASTFSTDRGRTYTITVGTGGNKGDGWFTGGSSGGNSEISATGNAGWTTVTAIGGGAGGQGAGSGAAGGSGGGASKTTTSTTSTYYGGAGTPGQGYDGGDEVGVGGAGGGGAGAAGGTSPSGAGGIGVQNSITGTAVYYAGGGGGGEQQANDVAGAGGQGGGGAGGDGSGTNGTDGLGGGGGGGGDGYGNTGGDGGDGIVIIRTTANALSTTGSPTLTTDGSYNIYTFTVSGTIAF